MTIDWDNGLGRAAVDMRRNRVGVHKTAAKLGVSSGALMRFYSEIGLPTVNRPRGAAANKDAGVAHAQCQVCGAPNTIIVSPEDKGFPSRGWCSVTCWNRRPLECDGLSWEPEKLAGLAA